jgi:peptidyl-prolyl cis-trans isomerase C
VNVLAGCHSRMSPWTREPLLHFAAIGLALFAVSRASAPGASSTPRHARIEVTEDDLHQLTVAWRGQWHRDPTAEELHGMVDTRVREEVLYREALALGLERDDTIVKRRLAQKMEFLSEDVSGIPEPTPADLAAWFQGHAPRFARPGRVWFRHLYFSFDRGRESARAAAVRVLATIVRRGGEPTTAVALSDRFMFLDEYRDRSSDEIGNVFGSTFAEALFTLAPRPAWQGPIESGFGWHLVWIDRIARRTVPAFEEVEPAVELEWLTDQRADAKRRAFDAMKARYTIVLPERAR